MAIRMSIRVQPMINLKDQEIFGYELLSKPIIKNQQLNHSSKQETFHFLSIDFVLEKFFTETNFDKSKKISVNLTKPEASNKAVLEGLLQLFKRHNFRIENVILEVSEKSSLQDVTINNLTYDDWKNQGFQIALDDYGVNKLLPTDLSGKLDFDIIKLDKNFLRRSSNPVDTILSLRSCVKSIKSEEVKIVMEGIETKTDLACAVGADIDIGQGYLLGRPKKIWGGLV